MCTELSAYKHILYIIIYIFAMSAYFSFCLQSRFLVLCICSDYGFLQRMAWETLSNLSEKVNSKIYIMDDDKAMGYRRKGIFVKKSYVFLPILHSLPFVLSLLLLLCFFFFVSLLHEQMSLEPLESSTTQMFFQILHFFLDHKDRYHVINGELFKWYSFVWY